MTSVRRRVFMCIRFPIRTLRRYIRNTYPNFWKLVMGERENVKFVKAAIVFKQEVLQSLLYSSMPVFLRLFLMLFGFEPFALTWLSVIFMVHFMTGKLNKDEYHETIVSPNPWIRFSANLLLGLLGFYLNDNSELPSNELEFTSYVNSWMRLIFSCVCVVLEDFSFYRLYLSLMRAIAITSREVNPNMYAKTKADGKHSTCPRDEKNKTNEVANYVASTEIE